MTATGGGTGTYTYRAHTSYGKAHTRHTVVLRHDRIPGCCTERPIIASTAHAVSAPRISPHTHPPIKYTIPAQTVIVKLLLLHNANVIVVRAESKNGSDTNASKNTCVGDRIHAGHARCIRRCHARRPPRTSVGRSRPGEDTLQP